MEKINSATGSRNLGSTREKKVGKKQESFLGFFNATETPESVQGANFSFSYAIDANVSLETLLDDVHSIGEKLVEKPFISNIKEYKQAVRRFLAYVINNAYSVESKIERRTLKRDEKKWINIKVVDEKLEKLALCIIQNQKGQLTILKKIEEIEGILIDLMR